MPPCWRDQDGVKSDVAVTWKWEISTDQTNWNTITDATTDSYTPGSDDIGDYLRVTATYDDEKGPGKTVEAETDAVLTAPATNTDALCRLGCHPFRPRKHCRRPTHRCAGGCR